MPIIQPNQIQCDKMEAGDVIYVRKVNPIYRLVRDLFFRDKVKIRVRKNWNEPIEYVEYYQEDCTLVYGFEIKCVQKYDNEVPCMISKNVGSKAVSTQFIKSVQVGLYNIQLQLNRFITLTIPTVYIDNAIKKNQQILKNCEDTRKIAEAIKFVKYKGSYFKKFVRDNHIDEWIPMYCSVCGSPIRFKFYEDNILIDNCCNCGVTEFQLENISYDEFALWYSNQSVNSKIIRVYNKFWFNKE